MVGTAMYPTEPALAFAELALYYSSYAGYGSADDLTGSTQQGDPTIVITLTPRALVLKNSHEKLFPPVSRD